VGLISISIILSIIFAATNNETMRF